MSARTGGNGDQSIRTLFDSLARKTIINDVMKGDAAPRMDRLIKVFTRAQGRDCDWHLPFRARRNIGIKPVVGLVDDLVDGIGGRRPIRIRPIVSCQLFRDLVEPFIKLRLWTRVQGRERTDNSGLALRNDQFRTGYDEEGRAYDRKPQAIEQRRWQCHGRAS